MISAQNLVDAELRINSHPPYFSIVILGAIVLTWVFISSNDIQKSSVGCSLRVFGRISLFAFGIGDILANSAPKAWIGTFGEWGSVLALFTLVCILTLL